MAELEKKYYSVKCKCGHVGAYRFYIPIEFGVIATSKKEAAEKARWIPRCKHHQKDCILDVKEITRSEFLELNEKNRHDPYLQCHSIQEQRNYDLSNRLVPEPQWEEPYKRNKERSTYMYGKRNVRHPKHYMRNRLKLQEAYCY